MFNRENDYSLIITYSYYYKNGKEYLTNNPYLHYEILFYLYKLK